MGVVFGVAFNIEVVKGSGVALRLVWKIDVDLDNKVVGLTGVGWENFVVLNVSGNLDTEVVRLHITVVLGVIFTIGFFKGIGVVLGSVWNVNVDLDTEVFGLSGVGWEVSDVWNVDGNMDTKVVGWRIGVSFWFVVSIEDNFGTKVVGKIICVVVLNVDENLGSKVVGRSISAVLNFVFNVDAALVSDVVERTIGVVLRFVLNIDVALDSEVVW